jgi:hypothetical protein
MKSTYFNLINATLVGFVLLTVSAASAQTVTASAGGAYRRPSSVRLGLQARVDMLNVLIPVVIDGEVAEPYVPFVSPGVRLLNDRLFIGLGFGLSGLNIERERSPLRDDQSSQLTFSVSPMAFYDLISDPFAAFALGGWFNLASISDKDDCDSDGNNCEDPDRDEENKFGWGINIGAQLRGKISPGLAMGGEFGWGFKSVSDGTDVFAHGIFGNILLEASVGL